MALFARANGKEKKSGRVGGRRKRRHGLLRIKNGAAGAAMAKGVLVGNNSSAGIQNGDGRDCDGDDVDARKKTECRRIVWGGGLD